MDFIRDFFRLIVVFMLAGVVFFEVMVIIALVATKDEDVGVQEQTGPKYNFCYVYMSSVESSQENKAVFDYLDDSGFEGKEILQLDIEIENAGEDEINEYYDLSNFTIKDGDDNYISSEFVNYYCDNLDYTYDHLAVIPSSKKGMVTYYILVDEDADVDTFHIYPEYDKDFYLDIEF